MTVTSTGRSAAAQADLAVLEQIQQRVLWLATRIVDAANHDRDTGDGVKVGGHQASSASLVSAMTALYFSFLDAADKVSVKPHASPVYHAIQYLLGNLDRGYLTTLRAFGGLQAYPSRTDIGLASEPHAHYVLVSTREHGNSAGPVEFRSYRIVDGVVTEEEISIKENR